MKAIDIPLGSEIGYTLPSAPNPRFMILERKSEDAQGHLLLLGRDKDTNKEIMFWTYVDTEFSDSQQS